MISPSEKKLDPNSSNWLKPVVFLGIFYKTWIVHPILVELKSLPQLKLDWEHTEHRWIKPEDINKFDIVPQIDKSLKRVLDQR